MDVALLDFCRLVCEQDPVRKKNFYEAGYAQLLRNGLRGFRKNTWWNTPVCRVKLAALYTQSEKAFWAALSLPKVKEQEARKDSDGNSIWKLAQELQRFGAPALTVGRNEEVELDSYAAFNAWVLRHKDEEDVANICRGIIDTLDPWGYALFCLKESHDSSAAAFARKFWSSTGAVLFYFRSEFRMMAQVLPIPETMRDGFLCPETGDTPVAPLPSEKAREIAASAEAAASPPAAPSATPQEAEQQIQSTVAEAVKPTPVFSLARRFREERTPELCRALVDGLTALRYYAAARDYALQLTYLVDENDGEEAAYLYLLSIARHEGLGEHLTNEVEAFRTAYPQSERLTTLESLLAALSKHAKPHRGSLFSRWAAKVNFWQQSFEAQGKLIRRGGNALLASEKIDALEFLHESLARVPDSGPTKNMLSQAQASLRLSAGAALTLKVIVLNDPNRNTVEDAWIHLVDNLMVDGRVPEAQAEFLAMKRQFVSPSRLDYVLTRYPEDFSPQALGGVLDAVRPQVTSGMDQGALLRSMRRPSMESLPYPRRYIGEVRRYNDYLNFFPKHVFVDDGWLQLTAAERSALYPKWGGLALRFANRSVAAALKEGRLYVAEFDRSDFLPTQDKDYQYAVEEPKVGRHLKGLSTLGCLIVKPCMQDVDLSLDTYVQLDEAPEDEAMAAVLDGELALLKVKEGLVGPFRLRMNVAHHLYIGRLSLKEQGEVPLWKPLGKAGVIRLVMKEQSPEPPVCARFALTSDAEAFSRSTVDLIKDEALLQVVVRKLPRHPTLGHTEEVLAAASQLFTGDRLARVERLLDDMRRTDAWAADMRESAVQCVLERLADERTQAVRPVTQAVVRAVNDSQDLQQLADGLTRQLAQVKAQHEKSLSEENEKYQARLRGWEKTLEEKRREVETMEAQLQARRTFVEQEVQRVVEKAKSDYASYKLSPFFDGLGSEGAAREVVRTRAPDEVDYSARAREAAPAMAIRRGTPADIRRHLVQAFRSRRCYTQDEAINLFVSLANNFLTLFSGEPGCGKTSVCAILADALGITDLRRCLGSLPAWREAGSCDRFLSVSVERGWTSKRDFLGYFNPLTQSFSASDRRRYEAFRLLAEENRPSEAFPFLCLLDEANLSPMEYYWADFMGICGGDDRAVREIVLGDNVVCRIPEHLRFLATVNIDDTTEPLSPRLLDRAWIIRLPEPEFNPAVISGAEETAVRWQDFAAAFGTSEPVTDVKEMQPFYDHMKKAGLTASMRSRRAIAQFVAVGAPLFEGGLATAVDYAVAQKLLPMVRGSGAGFKAWLEALRELCVNAPVSAGIVERILARGSNHLNFFQFF